MGQEFRFPHYGQKRVLMPIQVNTIHHGRFGIYPQTVNDTPEEAGHENLRGSDGDWVGWVMPPDPATDRFVEATAGKVVFEVGSGSGKRVVQPSLERGASLVFAVDIHSEHLELVEQAAADAAGRDRVKTYFVNKRWWDKLLGQPIVIAILENGTGEVSKLPADSSVDMMIARHVVQFGNPKNFLCFLDLADAALKVGGEVWGINMSPYLRYVYECEYDLDAVQGAPAGTRLNQIIQRNRQFLAETTEKDDPGGYTRVDVCIRKWLSEAYLDAHPGLKLESRFLYFDDDTFHGLYTRWVRSRIERGLRANLEIKYTDYFGPPRIWKANRLIEPKNRENKENHVFVLVKL